jgi:molybdopterin synthase catalytic subunit
MDAKRYKIVNQPIAIDELIDKVTRSEAGAITTFIGTVREWTKGKRTIYLQYEAYIPMALKMLEQIGHEISEKWPNTEIAITHRIGRLEITDIAVVIAVSSPHREAAYQANQYAIERIKQIVPIWKKEHWENGETWIGDQLEQIPYYDPWPTNEGGI